ncbi:MAG: integrase domain-containing protein [Burkholderiaceae bacterium]|nr:integrase domain-containing protein [Burkholderiaceae bacterium]
MSRKVQAKHSISVANQKLGGARITKVQRKQICKQFVNWCFDRKHLFNSIGEASLEMVRDYMQYLKGEGISIATQHNRLASIRRAMNALGRDPDKLGITAKSVGLEPRNRSGTKEPVQDDFLEVAIAKAIEINEPGFAIALRLQRLLGLRGLESLMSIPDLEKYALQAGELLSESVGITKGTKGGRSRFSRVILKRANETLITVREALVYMRTNGYLIEGGKVGLKSARAKYHRLSREVGLVGKFSPHSLRYAYAVEKIEELRDAGFNRKETLSAVAETLGHGTSRDRYVSMVYGKSVVHTVPVEKRKSRLERAIKNMDQLIDVAANRN